MRSDIEALYMHVPFCAKRCSYCDFSTQAVSPDDPSIEAYTEQMVLDIKHASEAGDLAHVQTVYLGGGTPSFIGTKHISRIVYALSIFMMLTDDIEFSMECNPDSLTLPLVKDAWSLGVNRLSIGVQSFDDTMLHTLGRIHDADTARRAIATAHERFDNVSIDLMCGIPGQTVDSFAKDVEEAVALGANHVSVYPLSIEPGTPFDKLVSSGAMKEPSDDTQAQMMEVAQQVLNGAGLARYEVASYARPGYECRHNMAYWTGVSYKGLGPSAVSMYQSDTERIREQDGEVVERLNTKQIAAEDLMLGMRMARGVSREQVDQAQALLPKVVHLMQSLIDQGLVVFEDNRYKPTSLGWLCGNELYGQLLDLAP